MCLAEPEEVKKVQFKCDSSINKSRLVMSGNEPTRKNLVGYFYCGIFASSMVKYVTDFLIL